MRIPVLPNAPMARADAGQPMGELRLRRNRALDFVENSGFDPALAVYDSSYENSQAHSALFRDHMAAMAAVLDSAFPQGSRLVEVGCGKGDFLSLLEARGHFSVRGYDATYVGTHPRIEARYLTAKDRIEADVVVMRHVLEHIPAPHRFLGMLEQVFGDVPVFIEVPEYGWIVQHQAFFDITYEHVNYFTPSALAALFTGPPRLQSTCFGGQYQYLLAQLGSLSGLFGECFEDPANWDLLAISDLFPLIEQRMREIQGATVSSSRIFIWGAATKGCMFLVHAAGYREVFGRVRAAVDVNPAKWNRFLPGSGVPIVSPETFFAQASPADVLLVANPNYRREIEATLTDAGLSGMRLVDL